ncbi:MAG TPA: SDR family NAD(P)-dependent oxidoreductase, partial [Solirubrobacterales bacterium]|nr:SDR family NAD(P)-dependent oxidoreductase [Solirubrobacterales bacterium]
PRVGTVPPLAETEERAPLFDPEATVLITGATGGIGALIARHLVSEHDARHLLLASRSGEKADGAKELVAELEGLGASVTIAACDVADKGQLEELLAAIPDQHPLGAVIHAAGALDDGTIESLDPGQIERVFAPKANAAWHLHELTKGADLSAFVLFSSLAGILGGPGQGNYAAANSFLDALAIQRQGEGLPTKSIAWGLWESGMGAKLGAADLTRLRRSGIELLSNERGLELFDQALTAETSLALAVPLDRAALRARAAAGILPSIMRGIVRAPARRRQAVGSSLATKLAAASEAEHESLVLELVRAEVAAVLGHSSANAIDPGRALNDLGFDSLAAVELRNRLGASTGLQLAPTIVFDYPNATALAGYLLAEVSASGDSREVAVRSQASDEPIAIVGMSCRYPGGIDSPDGLWRLVSAGVDAVSEFPTDRGWDLQRLYNPDPEHLGTSYTREGGFLAAAGDFDAEFFGIAPREAAASDPQQRLLLEAVWETLEDAGIDPGALRGSQTGVFAGVMYHDYGSAQEGLAPGVSSSLISGRVAYTLGLEGPAMTIDTACSSSLVAMHLAAQALRGGECSLALAGGVTVLATPNVFTEFSRQRGLAPDGRCKSFSDSADGVGWGEGVGVLALERLSDAEANGHPILATIRGSAVNQDGASNGLTAPNGPSQERVIRQALANARLTPQDIDAVEAHGTGTTLGDPIEAGALLATYGQDRERPLKLGTVKSNLGHTQAAAGVAGVIKTVMAMREGVLPKTLHVDQPSSKVDWEAGAVELLREPEAWEANGHPRRAAVSSFGISGTNAHLILEEAPASPVTSGGTDPGVSSEDPAIPGPVALALSAKSEPALRQSAERLAAHLRANPGLDPTDVAYSLLTSRASFKQRAVALGGDRERLLAALDAIARDDEGDGVVRGIARVEQRAAFLFAGQGAQHAGMALQLLDSSPAFARRIEECEQELAPFVDWSLGEVLRDEAGEWLNRLDVVQPALFAVMVSLAGLWRDHGVEPAVVVGHSQGEIAAAHVAGGLSLGDAARVIALRGKAMAKIAGEGGMLSVSLPAAALVERLAPFGERLSLAAINGPASLVVSGEPDALAQLRASCEEEDVRTQPIAVDYAAHSSQIEALEAELLEAFAPISPQSGSIPFHSTVSGELLDTAELGPEYWYRNLRQTVLLEPVLRSLLQGGRRAFIEIGPHPVLGFGLQETIDDVLDDEEATVLGSLRRDDGGPERFLRSLAEAHSRGVELDWETFFAGRGAKAVKLPSYPFQRKRYWHDLSNGSGDPATIGQSPSDHPLLGASLELASGEQTLLTGRLSLATHPWLADHALGGTAIFPGTGFVELALRAGEEVGAESIEELTLQAPLILAEQGAAQVQVSVGAADDQGVREISIHSRPEAADEEEEAGEWTCHASGLLTPATPPAPAPLGTWPPEGAEPLDVAELYAGLADLGLEYGPAFQGVRTAWRDGETIYAEVSLDEERSRQAGRFGVHPALLDAALHAGAFAVGEGTDVARLPFAWSGVSLVADGASELRVAITPTGEDGISLALFDASGVAVASVDSLALRALDPSQLRDNSAKDGLLEVRWSEVSLPEPSAEAGAEPELWRPQPDPGLDPAAAARALSEQALAALQAHLAAEDSGAVLAILTERAVSAREGEPVDPAVAAVWGLVRSAQTEHPGRFLLVDGDGTEASIEALPAVLASDEEPQIALREGVVLVPRAAPLQAQGDSLLPPAGPWRLDAPTSGTIEGLELIPNSHVRDPLGPTGVRVAMRAAGLNFRDVLVALGFTVPGAGVIGGEGSGVVVDVGDEVGDLAPGDRVMGQVPLAFAPLALSDRDLLAPVPDGWSFEQAAVVPIVFITAYYGLVELASLRAGQKVLIHAGAGGVGMAATQLAHHLGAEVFATASPAKWDVLREAGIAEDHIASSRDLDFKDKFLTVTAGEGVDVVLNSLAREYVDTSLELLPRGGEFLEMGRTDIRDAEQVAAEHPGVSYRAFDIVDMQPARSGEVLAEVTDLFERGALEHSPRSEWDVRRAPEAFRHLREGKNVGKVVLTIPRPIDAEATVLITGATGVLGALVARHLVSEHEARHLLLASRSGEKAEGAKELRDELQDLGAEVTIA